MLKEDFYNIYNSNIKWDKFKNKNVLITGANGFLPAYMAKMLLLLNKECLDNSCKVFALVRNIAHAREVFSKFLNDSNLILIQQDVTNPIEIKDSLHYIIHAASPASPKYYKIDPLSVSMPNIIGTINTLDLCLKHNIEGYLYFSSGEVYGQYEGSINENSFGFLDPTNIRSCYSESKRMGENLCISYGEKYSIPIKIVRPFHTYGPGLKLDDGRVFADFVKCIVENKNIVLKSSGSAMRPFCYLADATAAFFKILTCGAKMEAYNVANPNEYVSIKELAQRLLKLFQHKNLTLTFSEHDDSYLKSPINECKVDITKIKNLGWNPTTSIEEGFNKTIRSYL